MTAAAGPAPFEHGICYRPDPRARGVRTPVGAPVGAVVARRRTTVGGFVGKSSADPRNEEGPAPLSLVRARIRVPYRRGMTTMRHTVVERELELRLVLSPEQSVPVPAKLGYRSDDPYAVHITFHINSDRPVHWTFARELLVEGVFRPCGGGDVRVWPTKVSGRGVVLMALSSPDGDALLEAPAAAVSAWLERTLRIVPPGSEFEMLRIYDGLAELLAR
jgi:hypothetical protein